MNSKIDVKNSATKSLDKSIEISSCDLSGIYINDEYGIKVEIVGTPSLIEVNGIAGVEVFAKAWKNNQQIGFGDDGSIEIERFQVFNPPVLVDDSNGDIIRESTNSLTNELIVRKLRRDPAEALRSVIAHNIHIYGKLNTQIIKNKVGNTTATFFPDAHPESSSVDGFTMSNLGGSFASNRSGAGNSSNDSATNDTFVAVRGVGSSDGYCHRLITLFNTSLLGNSTITSATYSLYATAVGTVNSPTFALVGCTPASNTAIVNADFTATTLNSPTEYITRIAISSFNIGSYTDMALNANGLAAISKNGITKFMGREGKFDVDNTDPNTSSTLHLDGYFADETGTTKDPKLTVVYTKLSDFLGYFF